MSFESLPPGLLPWGLGALALGLVLGFVVGRTTGRWHARLRRLQEELSAASARLQAASDELKRREEEFEGYRTRVVEHFAGASDLFQDLTLQYRTFYDHLARGARTLCPEGSLQLESSLEQLALATGEELRAAGGAGEPDEAPEAAQGGHDEPVQPPRD
jgi:uncharacterized membrane-anchored protein YhcB (DUF1043 family)